MKFAVLKFSVMTRHKSFSLSRQLSIAISSVAVLICFLLLWNGPLRTDPQEVFFFKAQQLQTQGLLELALKHYHLISDLHPESAYAPAALKAQADILTGLARKNADRAQFGQAIDLYRRLADTYNSDRASGDALLTAAGIAKDDLGDATKAREILKQVLERFPNNAGYSSQATLRLGRLALDEGQKDDAKTLLQSVLQKYPRLADVCAEAQYHLGVLFETLFQKKEAAKDAYIATFEHYPRTVWAANAQERLGMLWYKAADKHPERLVLLEVPPVPDNGDGANGILEALRPLLAARGLGADASTLRGWSLKPFWGAFDPNRPGRVVEAPFSAFINVVANAGLKFDRREGTDEKSALDDLQHELDTARAVVIYNGAWRLVVGYDSVRQEVFVQSRGARVQAFPVKDFLADWKSKAPDGGPFTMMTFYASGEKERVSRVSDDKAKIAATSITRTAITRTDQKATPTMPVISPRTVEPTPTPVPTPVPLGLTPIYVFELKPLSAPDAHRRALRQAVNKMRQSRMSDNDTALLNLDALDAIATALERVAKAPAATVGEESPVPLPESETLPEKLAPEKTAMPDATPTLLAQAAAPTPVPTVSATQKVQRARQLAQWFRAPLQSWVRARRDAASYLQGAAGPLRRAALKQAADNLRLSVNELSSAAAAMPLPDSLEENGALSEIARNSLLEAARHVRAARDAEARAVDQMDF